MSLHRSLMCCAALAASFLFAASASANALFETTPDLSDSTFAAFSDSVSGTGQLFGGSFTVDQDSYVTGFAWMGVNTGNMDNLASFTVEIWSNAFMFDNPDNPIPGEKLAAWTVNREDANMVNTGHKLSVYDVFSFSAALDAPFEIDGGEIYWLVLYGNSTPGSMFAWLKAERHQGTSGAAFSNQDGSGAQWWPSNPDVTFTVFGSPVPEPAAMGVIGLAGLLMLRRRHSLI